MLFNSMHFLVFFPVVVLAYYLIPQRLRWGWLLLASTYFYMAWNPKYILLIAASILITYLAGRMVGRSATKGQKKLWVGLSLGANLAILFFFKYFNFALDNLNAVLGAVGIQLLQPGFDVLLPVGISFYTFQALGYTIDVYRGDIAPEKHLGKYALFVSFFPQLVAGPIERSKNLLPQIDEPHPLRASQINSGLLRMAWGLFQKIVIADRVAILVNTVYGNHRDFEGLQLVLATMLFAVQIYCDFAGYTNIAIGAARILGYRLMENFKEPYFATSIRDFWKRWHISLSSWFRDYLYIPLGGSRKGRLRTYANVMITFLASGLWHGANWAFVIWGGLHGAYQVLGDVLRPLKTRLWRRMKVRTDDFSFKLGQAIVTFLLVCFAWIFFRAPGASAAFEIIARMFQSFNYWIFFDGTIYELGLDRLQFWQMVFAIAILVVVDVLRAGRPLGKVFARQNAWLRWAVYLFLVVSIGLFGVYGDSYAQSQFIYFQF